MKKGFWIGLSIAFLLVSLFSLYRLYMLRRACFSPIYQLGLDKKCRFYVFTVIWPPSCDFSLSEDYIKTLTGLKFGNRVCVYFVFSEGSKQEIKKLRIPKDRLIFDKDKTILKRAGYFLPSIVIMDRKGRILFLSPVFSDPDLQHSLLTSAIKTLATTLRVVR